MGSQISEGCIKKCLFRTLFSDICLINCWLISFLIASRTVFVYITAVQYKTNYYSNSPNLLQQSHFFRFCLFFFFFSPPQLILIPQTRGSQKDENCRQKSARPGFFRGLSWGYWRARWTPQPQVLEGPQIRIVLHRKVKKSWAAMNWKALSRIIHFLNM